MVYSIFDCFCQTRIASVKCLLGLLDEAVMVYNEILDEQSDYVPALKGTGDFLRNQAYKDLDRLHPLHNGFLSRKTKPTKKKM